MPRRAMPLMTVAFALFAIAPALAAETAGSQEQPDLLSPDLGSAVWSIVLFLLLLIVLGKFVWPPILKGLQDREAKIRSDIEDAEAANREAQVKFEAYEKKLAEAHADVREMLEQARADADDARAKMLSGAEQEVANLRQRATDEIRSAKQQAVQDLYAQAAELATAVAGKMLQRQVDGRDAQKLIDQSLDEMNKAG